jgi:radical SAM protein with 4Fe4S-binding SPASM domain
MFDFCVDHGVKSLNILPLDYTGFAANNVKYLFLSDSDEIKAAEKFAVYLRDKYPNIDMIDLDSRFILPPLMDYLENNFHISLPIARNCCGATTTFGYIDPFGNLYPCDRVAFEFADIDFGKDTDKKKSLVDNNFFEIWNSNYFTEMFKFITDRSHYLKYEPCNRCEYLDAGYCVPCPLYALRNEKIVFQQCLFAERKNGSLRLSKRFQDTRKTGSHYLNQYQPKKIEVVPTKSMEILNTMIVKKENGILSNIEAGRQIIFSPENNKFYSINSDGANIWSSIDKNLTVEEIAAEFSEISYKKLNEIYNSVDLSCFGDNAEVVKEFIRALSSEGLVTLE